ncbi:MAG: pyridoxal-phosphate dependent enzyme, partial [Chloroflexi bacterium]|nr:pyridoxal-phosphate dependent enzyme [Chloroflexota bacterium]
MNTQPMPTLKDVIAARAHVYRYLQPTPLHHYATLSELIGAQIWVKHENHQPIGAFKVRGGLVLAAHLSDVERQGGLFTAS